MDIEILSPIPRGRTPFASINFTGYLAFSVAAVGLMNLKKGDYFIFGKDKTESGVFYLIRSTTDNRDQALKLIGFRSFQLNDKDLFAKHGMQYKDKYSISIERNETHPVIYKLTKSDIE